MELVASINIKCPEQEDGSPTLLLSVWIPIIFPLLAVQFTWENDKLNCVHKSAIKNLLVCSLW